VNDRAFSGSDVAEAVREAALTLGLPEKELRYFVLEPGRPGSLGVAPMPARIAVIMGAPSKPRAGPLEREARPAATPTRTKGETTPAPRAPAPLLPDHEPDEPVEERLHRVTEAISRTANLRLEGHLEAGHEAAVITLETSDPEFFLGADGEGKTWEALEQLLHRMFVSAVHPRKLRIELRGHRDRRDLALRRRTLLLVEEVKASGRSRETAPLNAYERRIVHLAVATAGGVLSRSEGEGGNRRVVISLADDPGPGGEVF